MVIPFYHVVAVGNHMVNPIYHMVFWFYHVVISFYHVVAVGNRMVNPVCHVRF
jgi:hypothetical protein